MSNGEYAGTKITIEMLESLAVPIIVKKIVTSGLFKPNELKILFDKGKGSVETGIREIGSILARGDIPDPDTWNKGIRKITIGAINIGACWAVTKSLLASGGKKGLEQRIKNKNLACCAWQSHVRNRVGEIHHETPRKSGTFIRDSIKRDSKKKAGISLPKDRILYDFILVELKALKRRGR